MSYNGWTNRATWAWQLHMNNDEFLQTETRRQVLSALASEGRRKQRYGWCHPASQVAKEALQEGFWYWHDLYSDGEFQWMKSILDDVGNPFDIDWDNIAPHWYGPEWDYDSQRLYDHFGCWL